MLATQVTGGVLLPNSNRIYHISDSNSGGLLHSCSFLFSKSVSLSGVHFLSTSLASPPLTSC